MLIGLLVELYVGLHSCLCFSPLEKLFWKAGSTPPRYLAICLLKPFSYHNPDSSSIPGGSIENAPASSIASRHLVDRSSFCSWIWFLVARYLLDTSTIDDHFLDTYLDSFLNTSWYLHLSSFTEGLYIHFFTIWSSFLWSLSICPHLFISQTPSLSLQTSSFVIFQAFSRFFFSW